MILNYDLYENICDLLVDENLTVEEIAEMVGVTPEVVQYVSAAEEI